MNDRIHTLARHAFWPTRNRRGVTVLVVMGLVSLTLAMSFVILRTQMTGVQLQSNTDRGTLARQAALAGLNAGVRAMRSNTWGGVDSTLTGTLSANDTYSVTFTAGDDALAPGNAAYGDYPYRVTLRSTGRSADPANSALVSTYDAEAVLQMTPKQLSAAPANWSTIIGYTLYQMTSADTRLAFPCRIDGPVRLQGKLDIEDPYNWSDAAQKRYLNDLHLMRSGVNEVQTIVRSGVLGGTFSINFNGGRTAEMSYNASSGTVQNALQNLPAIGAGNVSVSSGGSGVWIVTFQGQLAATNVPQMSVNTFNLLGLLGFSFNVSTTVPGVAGTPDYRPLSGPIFVPTNQVDSKNLGLLATDLALTVNNIAQSSTASLPINPSLGYRLYPKGPLYTIAQLPSNCSNLTLAPNPVTNPLGIYYCSSNCTLGNNVTITGTVVVGGDLQITGNSVNLSAANLSPLDGTSTNVQLPAVVSLGDLRVGGGVTVTITGVVMVGDELRLDQGSDTTRVAINGNVIVGSRMDIRERNEWNYGGSQWDSYYNTFLNQLNSGSRIPFFPQWFSTAQGRSYVPKLTIAPSANSVTKHWPDLDNPIYAIASGDSGLCWDLVSWDDR